MIGGCIISGKYNMTAAWWEKGAAVNPNTGQVKADYTFGAYIPCIARGLSNLRGKDSGTMQDYRNKLDEYHYLRVKTATKLDDGDILTQITDANGDPYMDWDIQFVVLGVTPTFDPFGNFIEYDVLLNEAEVTVKLLNTSLASSDSTTEISSDDASAVSVV